MIGKHPGTTGVNLIQFTCNACAQILTCAWTGVVEHTLLRAVVEATYRLIVVDALAFGQRRPTSGEPSIPAFVARVANVGLGSEQITLDLNVAVRAVGVINLAPICNVANQTAHNRIGARLTAVIRLIRHDGRRRFEQRCATSVVLFLHHIPQLLTPAEPIVEIGRAHV